MVFLLILLISLVVQLFGPWYFIVPVAYLATLFFGKSASGSFWQALGAIAILWGTYATYLHLYGEGIITHRIAGMFGLPIPELLIPITMLTGGLVSGLAALSGYYTKYVINRGSWKFR